MRFIRLTAMTLLILTLIVGVMLIVMRSLPPRHPLAQFHFTPCGDRACFMGIKPGETSIVDARNILLSHGGREYSTTDIAVDVGAYEVHALSFNASPNITVIDVRLNLQPDIVMNSSRFADFQTFLEEFGPPCAIYHIAASPQIELIYPFLRLYTIVQDDHIQIDTHSSAFTSTFTITVPNRAVCDPKESATFAPWRGFASLDFYRSHGLQDE